MSAFYRCLRHGRFPITDVIPELKTDAIALFKAAAASPTLPCPKCGAVCKACKTRRTNG